MCQSFPEQYRSPYTLRCPYQPVPAMCQKDHYLYLGVLIGLVHNVTKLTTIIDELTSKLHKIEQSSRSLAETGCDPHLHPTVSNLRPTLDGLNHSKTTETGLPYQPAYLHCTYNLCPSHPCYHQSVLVALASLTHVSKTISKP